MLNQQAPGRVAGVHVIESAVPREEREVTVIGRLRRVRHGGVIDVDLARDVWEYRVAEGLTQRDLAAKVSVHPSTICMAEQARSISVRFRAKMRKFLDEAKKEAHHGNL